MIVGRCISSARAFHDQASPGGAGGRGRQVGVWLTLARADVGAAELNFNAPSGPACGRAGENACDGGGCVRMHARIVGLIQAPGWFIITLL